MKIDGKNYAFWALGAFERVSGALTEVKNGRALGSATLHELFNVGGLADWLSWNWNLTAKLPKKKIIQRPARFDQIEHDLSLLVAVWSARAQHRDVHQCAEAITHVLLDRNAPIRTRLKAHNNFMNMQIWRSGGARSFGVTKNFIGDTLFALATDETENQLLREAAFNNYVSIVTSQHIELKAAYIEPARKLMGDQRFSEEAIELFESQAITSTTIEASEGYRELMAKMRLEKK